MSQHFGHMSVGIIVFLCNDKMQKDRECMTHDTYDSYFSKIPVRTACAVRVRLFSVFKCHKCHVSCVIIMQIVNNKNGFIAHKQGSFVFK